MERTLSHRLGLWTFSLGSEITGLSRSAGSGASGSVFCGSEEGACPAESDDCCKGRAFWHRPWRCGRQSTHDLPDFLQEQFLQRPLALHRQQTGIL